MRAKSAQNGHIARELLALRDPDKMLDMKAMERPKCRPSRWHIEPVIRAKSIFQAPRFSDKSGIGTTGWQLEIGDPAIVENRRWL
jgi:hypothetical protein